MRQFKIRSRTCFQNAESRFRNCGTCLYILVIFRSGSGGAQGTLFGGAPQYAKIFMDEVNCTGTEASIDLCHFNGWGVHDCGHNEDAGVICNSGG